MTWWDRWVWPAGGSGGIPGDIVATLIWVILAAIITVIAWPPLRRLLWKALGLHALHAKLDHIILEHPSIAMRSLVLKRSSSRNDSRTPMEHQRRHLLLRGHLPHLISYPSRLRTNQRGSLSPQPCRENRARNPWSFVLSGAICHQGPPRWTLQESCGGGEPLRYASPASFTPTLVKKRTVTLLPDDDRSTITVAISPTREDHAMDRSA